MNSQNSKFSTIELVAIGYSLVVLLIGIIYWITQAVGVIDLLNAAYAYSVFNVIGRFVLVVIGAAAFIALVVFVQRRFNKH